MVIPHGGDDSPALVFSCTLHHNYDTIVHSYMKRIESTFIILSSTANHTFRHTKVLSRNYRPVECTGEIVYI